MKDKIPEHKLRVITINLGKPKVLYRTEILGQEMWIEGPLRNVQDN